MKLSMTFGVMLLMCISASAQEEKIDARLKKAMASVNETDFLNVIVKLNEQAKFDGENLDRIEVLTRLQQIANTSQIPIRQFLNDKHAAGNVEVFRAYYILNGFGVRCQKSVIEDLSRMLPIAKLYLDEVFLIEDSSSTLATKPFNYSTPTKPSSSSYWWNLTKIGVDKVRENLGINGSGILVGIIDTGFSSVHPDLAPRWKSTYLVGRILSQEISHHMMIALKVTALG